MHGSCAEYVSSAPGSATCAPESESEATSGRTMDASADTWGRARAPVFGYDHGSALKFTAHSNRRAEPSLGGVDVLEADPLIEALGRSCRHLETPGTTT
jgi:hypothetical protein